MVAVRSMLSIPANGSESGVFEKKGNARGFLVHVPTGVQGVIAILVSDSQSGPFAPVTDSSGSIVVIDPGSLPVTPTWAEAHTATYGAHYVKLATFVDATLATPQTQSAERSLPVMGIA